MTTPRESVNGADPAAGASSAAAVSIVTTEHFTLQGARAATVAEANGRAGVFLGAVSGGLVALGLFATATRVGAAFYAFGLVLLPALCFLGLVTFDRALQSGLEDLVYGRRIARLRGFYFAQAPELTGYLLSVPAPDRLRVQGLRGGRWQGFLTVAGSIAVITAMLAGATAGLLAAVTLDHSLWAAVAAGLLVAAAALAVLMRFQRHAWEGGAAVGLFPNEDVRS
jgi:hypothetical protein